MHNKIKWKEKQLFELIRINPSHWMRRENLITRSKFESQNAQFHLNAWHAQSAVNTHTQAVKAMRTNQ